MSTIFGSTQSAVGGARVTGHGAVEALSAFLRDSFDFIQQHPLLMVGLAALALVFFRVTQPRVH